MVKYLISIDKIELNAKDSEYRTVLHYACKSGNQKLVEYLVNLQKIDIYTKDLIKCDTFMMFY